jgi:hypothetical protein
VRRRRVVVGDLGVPVGAAARAHTLAVERGMAIYATGEAR